MGNALPSSNLCTSLPPETNDLLSTRWSLINALKQHPCKPNSIMALLRMSNVNYGSDALMNLKDGNGRTLLMLCIDRKLPEAVEYLLVYDKTVDVEARDNCYGWSAIMYAISTNQFNIVKGLVDMNCKIDEKDRNGMTCLMQASLQGFHEIAALLIDRGARLDTVCADSHFKLSHYNLMYYNCCSISYSDLQKRRTNSINVGRKRWSLI